MPIHFNLGCLPPTLNEITDTARRSRFKSADTKKKWTEYICKKARKMKKMYSAKKVYMECVWFIKNFQRDPDNIEAAQKYILDGLVTAKVIKDDSLCFIQSPVIHWFEKAEFDSLVFLFYNEREWKIRQAEGIQLPNNIIQPAFEVPDFTASPTKTRKPSTRRRRTSPRKQSAK